MGAIAHTEKQVQTDWIGRANRYISFLQKLCGMDSDTMPYHNDNPLL